MRSFFLILSLFVIGCNSSLERTYSTQYDTGSFNQLTKTDFDRMADYEIKENTESLRILALKFYKKNPAELRKTTSDSPEVTVNWLFTNQHNWKFKEINDAQGIQALDQVLDESFEGDRVLSLITGLYTMLITAHDNQKEFDMFDSLDPQLIYNAARNVEVIVWRLSSKRKKNGELFLVTNEINDDSQNLSFEREFGKIIGRTDYFAYVLSEKKERYITRAVQGTTLNILLPFL